MTTDTIDILTGITDPRPSEGGAENPQATPPTLQEMVSKIAALNSVFLHTARTQQLMARLEQLKNFGNVGRGTGSPSRNLLVTGPSHVGKTSILRRFEREYPPIPTETITLCPVLYVEILLNSTCKGVIVQTLKALGVPVGSQSTDTTVLGLKLIEWLRKKQVDVIIFDEFQHIVEEKTKTQIYNGGDLLKAISNSGTAIVVSGLEEAAEAYDENKALQSRTAGRFHLSPLNWSNPEDRTLFRALLSMYAKELPFPEPSDLAALDIAMPLYHFSGGLFGRAVPFIVNAATQGLLCGARRLNREILRRTMEGYRDSREKVGWFNPFDVAEDRLRLVPVERDIRNQKTRLRNGVRKAENREG